MRRQALSLPRCAGLALLTLVALTGAREGVRAQPAPKPRPVRAVLLPLEAVNARRLGELRREGYNGIVLPLEDPKAANRVRAVAQRALFHGVDVYYWIEVGRSPALAEEHPAWMASLQGHENWRRHFPDAPKPRDGEVVKNYPWVPVLYRDAFDAHLRRVEELLKHQARPKGILLNDLQGPPSACGCGNALCRWTADYGPIKTAAPHPGEAAAQFVERVEKLMPRVPVIPVWTPECEEHDGTKEGACNGVGCFNGICWNAFTEQLMPVAGRCDLLGAFVPYKALGQDLPRFREEAGWVGHALGMFAKMPPQRKGKAVAAEKLLAVLQGWDVTPKERQAQITQAERAGARGFVVAEREIPQGWEPRIYRLPAKK